jgi:hypothetical protein
MNTTTAKKAADALLVAMGFCGGVVAAILLAALWQQRDLVLATYDVGGGRFVSMQRTAAQCEEVRRALADGRNHVSIDAPWGEEFRIYAARCDGGQG